MSVEIKWETITSGSDGEALAESIRSFIHDKFQQITLPRFISSVKVHSFDFGSVCPEINIKDVCDPLPEFSEDDEDDEDEEDEDRAEAIEDVGIERGDGSSAPLSQDALRDLQARILQTQGTSGTSTAASVIPLQHTRLPQEPPPIDTQRFPSFGQADLLSPFPRSGTPGIPGGTSNLSYFHLPLGGLSGTHTPLAAVASGTPFSANGWPNEPMHHFPFQTSRSNLAPSQSDIATSSRNLHSSSPTRPSTANTLSPPEELGSPFAPGSPGYQATSFAAAEKVADNLPFPPLRLHPAQASDLQVVARVKYAGDVRMTLTAEILLDYPMPSFVGIPLMLSITGVTFDGVAIIASIRKKAHFCFLSPEDAEALIGADAEDEDGPDVAGKGPSTMGFKTGRKLGGLLEEIRVESEIGRKETGKQVLKNVGKVEKFVLEQVRRIFEEEFVFPSFWTFLV